MIPFAKVDPEFAKQQLVLFLREWYMAPNGQIPGEQRKGRGGGKLVKMRGVGSDGVREGQRETSGRRTF